jgi:putative FmdB family regulatory protein
MPIREYMCRECGEVYEWFYRTTEKQKKVSRCRKCGGKADMVLSKTSFILKGSGWYATDYASGGEKKDKDNDKGRVREKSG